MLAIYVIIKQIDVLFAKTVVLLLGFDYNGNINLE